MTMRHNRGTIEGSKSAENLEEEVTGGRVLTEFLDFLCIILSSPEI